VTKFISEMSKEEVKEWAAWTRAARLGELIYKDPYPLGCSLVKGAPNFKVSVSDSSKLQFDR
jgi:hypothetical protein